MSTVFLSGATGFIAQHLVRDLIAKGYKVIGSVRSAEKGDLLTGYFPKNFEYTIVEDIESETAFDDVLQKNPEITAFFHTASPFHYGNDNIPERLLQPAINGTKNALASAKKYGSNLKNFIVTSSVAAVGSSFLVNPHLPMTTVINEESWTEISWEQASTNGFIGYSASKAFAEREVWKFVDEEKPSFAVSVVNPSFVFGPQAFDAEAAKTLGTSSELINSLLKAGPDAELPAIKGRWVDVRDVSKAHIVALENKDAAGKRIIVQNGKYNAGVVAQIMLKNFPELKDRLPKFDAPAAQEALSSAAFGQMDDSKSVDLLGFEKVSLEQCITDAIAQLLKVGKQ
ncbi:NADPH-dependent methylglyoxal reductase GRE2 [Suhomyces tanzawaensis NRRL Y-17324]|uniref:NADPH-dependent methylglyoxal reductase GRE2 n=1 Tax=Suhomyces tanzawaensis NRRL Y-17324 TaxID=984487 RepID=A0A1E4SB78_9ASCO|nr:NADPH-dependent methylglyoxal reductase GRE2 [Suhomyces tanzawaensis NRRL Y-17324]ODV76726.1 NADPH-dependent methylglyoxal reductase GRE2 [Suhomyces tanzawaensis NRRL Y-17324]